MHETDEKKQKTCDVEARRESEERDDAKLVEEGDAQREE